MAEAKVTVSIERIAHDCLRDIAKQMWQDHGLLITDVRFNWASSTYIGGQEPGCLLSADVQTQTKVA